MENKKRVFHDKERSDGSRKGVSGEVGGGVLTQTGNIHIPYIT